MLHPAIRAYCEEDIVDIRGFDRCKLIDAQPGRYVLRAYPGPDCANNIGTVHGGFLMALVDLAGTGASDTLGIESATITSSVNFLRPVHVDDAYIDAEGTVLKEGKRAVVCEVEIVRPSGEIALKATVTTARFDSKIVELERFASLSE